jgi:SNF2 family DNA or RNA helicase
MELKRMLFGWHAKSFYGTLVETVEKGDVRGIVLNAEEAADFFVAPASVRHSTFVLDRDCEAFRRLAVLFVEHLREGRIVPSYEKWLKGKWGWKPIVSDERKAEYEQACREAMDAGMDEPDGWLDDILAAWMKREAALREAWEQVAAAYRLLPAAADSGSPGEAASADSQSAELDEEDWLIAIGWKTDDAPFRTCLRLIEPASDGVPWTLDIVLQDLEDAELTVEYDADRPDVALAGVPESWRAHIPNKIDRALRKWVRIVPWLERAAVPGRNLSSDAIDRNRVDLPGIAAPSWYGGLERNRGEPTSPTPPDSSAPTASASNDTSAPRLLDELSDEQAWAFLDEASVRLLQAGCTVLLPGWWEEVKRQKPRLKAVVHSAPASAAPSLFGLQQLIEFDWKVAVGDMDMSEEQFRKLAQRNRRLVRLGGRWIRLDPAWVKQIREMMKQAGRKGLTFREVLELHLVGDDPEEERSADGQPLTDVSEGKDGAGTPKLRVEVELNEHLAALIGQLNQSERIPQLKPSDKFAGQLRNYQAAGSSWLSFLRRYGLGAVLADDMGLGKTVQWIAHLLHVRETEQIDTPALLICPTSVLGNWQKELERFAPTLTVYLHYGSQRVKGEGFAPHAKNHDVVLTSYALSHLDEEELASVYWSSVCLDEAQNIKNANTKQAAAVRKLQAGHRIALTGTPIENRLTELWSIFDFVNPGYLGSLPAFARRYVQPIERTNDPRLIGQVQRLVRPFLLRREKTDPTIQLDLPEKSESKVYVHLTAEQGAIYEDIVRELLEHLDKLSAMERRGAIFAALTRLKQVCDHPALLQKEPPEAIEAERSNKLVRLLEMVRELRDEGDRCLIFTQYVEMGQMLKRLLEREQQEPVEFLHGGVPKAKRDRMIARFQQPDPADGPPCDIFILSLKAGGTGLNLTGANHVFHFDRWWNPAVENQATDRAFRIGQTRNVQVHKFVTLGTLEERIDSMIERKQGLSRQIVGGENWITELTTDELKELFQLRRQWIDN